MNPISSLQAIRRRPDQHDEADSNQHDERRKQLPVHAAEEQDAMATVVITAKAPKSGSRSSNPAVSSITTRHRQKTFAEAVYERRFANGVVGGIYTANNFISSEAAD